MIPRQLAHRLRRDAAVYPVLTITGPRQSGKTTLARAAFPEHRYISLEDPEQRALALDDPRGFLGQFGGGAILDEAQRAPELFSYLQPIVDGEDRPGRFVLTGSQNFLLLRSVSQSLAGRCAVRHLLPFSLDELARRPPLGLDVIGRDVAPDRPPPPVDLLPCLFTGFYPRIHDKGLEPQDWLASYYQTYLERDVREVLNVGDLEAFRRFVALCAGRSGQLLNLSALALDAGVTHTTARRWLSVLEASFLVVRLAPHHRNFNKRLVKTPKLYFLDTGLLCYLLRIRSAEDLRLHPARGAVFETFVVAELYKRALHHGEEPHLYFWRDATGHEVDVLLDRGSSLVPVEVKSGETLTRDAFRGLEYWRELTGAGGPAALVYGGDATLRRHDVVVYGWAGF